MIAVLALCLVVTVFALSYAIATGKEVPAVAGHVLGLIIQALLGV